MIAADTSALMAILFGERHADVCMDAQEAAEALAISAGTMAEALIVADHHGVGAEIRRLIDGLGFEVESVTPAEARRIAAVYASWGKGVDPAGLNVSDCFAYALASERDVPLLYVGDDFAQTDIRPAPQVNG